MLFLLVRKGRSEVDLWITTIEFNADAVIKDQS